VAGLHLNFFYVKQLPVLLPEAFEAACPWADGSVRDWIRARVVALSCSSWSMAPMAEELTGQRRVYPWEPEKRFLIRCEIDAAMFRLYGVPRDDLDYIMDTFRIVKEDDEAAKGEYRTKRIFLEIYDAMQEAIDSGVPYEPIVDLPALQLPPSEGVFP
jgi:hypothetical protein